MFHHESWEPIYLGVKRSTVKVTSHKTLPACVFALLWVRASSGYVVDELISCSRRCCRKLTLWTGKHLSNVLLITTAVLRFSQANHPPRRNATRPLRREIGLNESNVDGQKRVWRRPSSCLLRLCTGLVLKAAASATAWKATATSNKRLSNWRRISREYDATSFLVGSMKLQSTATT